MSAEEKNQRWWETHDADIVYAELSSPLIAFYLEDCLQGLRNIFFDESVSIVVTSPPYNIRNKYNKYKDHRKDYFQWMSEIAKELKRVLEPSGSVFLNVGSIPSKPMFAWEVAEQFITEGFELLNVIHWIKSITIEKDLIAQHSNLQGDISLGHYKPMSSKRFLHNCQEYVFHFTKTKTMELDIMAIGVPYQDKSNITRWKTGNGGKRSRGNVWFIPYETITDRLSQRPHPASFPVRLPEMCIRLHGLSRTRLVLDPFIGIGSTALACKKLNVPCAGYEIDEEYLDYAVKRIKAYDAK